MKKILLSLLFLGILVFPSYVHADGPYLNIPPTNAFDKAHSQNGTINAVNFSMPINFIGRNGVNVTSNNSTHTIIIIGNGTGPRGATGATGSFVCNTGNNCVNLNDTQNISGSKDFINGLNITNNYLLEFDTPFSEGKLQGLDGTAFSAFEFMPPNDTTAYSFQLDVRSDPNSFDNFIGINALHTDNTITSKTNSTWNTPFDLRTLNKTAIVTDVTLSSIGNEVSFNNATLHNIQLPSSNLDAINKYWHDHYLGQIGNLTQNKCSNLEFLAYQQSNQTWICSTGSFHGTYNETLANNVVINSGGKGINLLNGTGNPVNVVNDPTRNQVNVTISDATPIFTTRTIDLSGAAYNTVIDNNTGTISITATSKPANPQFVQTISAGNIPTDTTDVQDYTVILTVGGKNTNATTAKTISMIPTRNGVEVDTTRAVVLTNGNFWESGYYLSGSALTAGDKIGLKMWCSSSPCSSGGGLDFRYATLYIVPRQFISTSNSIYTIIPAGNILTLSGSIGGITYSTGTPAIGTNTAGTIIDSILGSGSGQTSFKGQNLSELVRATTDTGTNPAQQAGSDLMSISFAKFVRINTLS